MRVLEAREAICSRLADNLGVVGGWDWHPDFPKKTWEIVKRHYFSLIFHENLSISMKNRGFWRFPNVYWEIIYLIGKLTTLQKRIPRMLYFTVEIGSLRREVWDHRRNWLQHVSWQFCLYKTVGLPWSTRRIQILWWYSNMTLLCVLIQLLKGNTRALGSIRNGIRNVVNCIARSH